MTLLASLVVSVLIGGPILVCVWPRGEKVGQLDLLTEGAKLKVPTRAHGRLLFRLDVQPGGKVTTAKLRNSSLSIELVLDGAKVSTSCAAYSGVAMMSSPNSVKGIMIGCELPTDSASGGELTARATWVSGFRPGQALLEVRVADR